MRVAAIAFVMLAGACSSPTGRGAELGDYASVTPVHGAYVRLITPAGERWRATFDKDANAILIRGAWQKEGSKKITMRLTDRSIEPIWQHQVKAMAGGEPAWRHTPGIRIELAMSDGDQAKLVRTQGWFIDGEAKALFEGIKGFVPDPADPANQQQ
jgi:hypothetical protein